MSLGEPPKNFGVLCPANNLSYCVFIDNFSKIFKIRSFLCHSFSKKIPQNLPKKFHIFQLIRNQKNGCFAFKLVPNHYIDQNSAKYSQKFPMFLQNIISKNFLPLRHHNFGVVGPKTPIFWS